MKISINLVTWNGAKYIKNCLESVFNQTTDDFDVLIIDNGSSDDTLDLIQEQYPHLRVVKHRENLGFGKAHNQAIHWSKSDYVLVLNQDTVLHPDFVRTVIEFLDKNVQVGSVTGKILRLQDGIQTSYIDSLGLQIQKNHRVTEIAAGQQDNGDYEAITEVFGISGAVAIYRRKALDTVMYNNQYFDEDFFSYKEDVDLAYRLRYAGWKSYYLPLAVCYHVRSVSGSEANTKMKIAKNRKKQSKFGNFFSLRNHYYLLLKNVPKFNFKYLWPILRFEFLKFIYVLIFETSHLKALSEAYKNRKKFLEKRRFIMDNKKIKIEEIDKWFVKNNR